MQLKNEAGTIYLHLCGSVSEVLESDTTSQRNLVVRMRVIVACNDEYHDAQGYRRSECYVGATWNYRTTGKWDGRQYDENFPLHVTREVLK